MPKPRKLHGLKLPKIRQSWNKFNLYNLARVLPPRLDVLPGTYFQQKWKAKNMLRSYHGEHVVERKWTRMFSRRLLAVSRADPQYLANFDGSEMARGKGYGLGKRLEHRMSEKRPPNTPYMQMTFAPMERRLDIAVFRAMFASSARQAAQFCIHRAVKVNGKVMPYPSYQLNPGDMFQVDPDRVLFATGLPKHGTKLRRPRDVVRKRKSSKGEAAAAAAEEVAEEAPTGEEASNEAEAASPEQDPDTTDAPEPVPQDMKPAKKEIQALVRQAKEILRGNPKLTGGQKRRIREFLQASKSLLSRAGRSNASPLEITDELTSMLAKIKVEDPFTPEKEEGEKKRGFRDLNENQKKRLQSLIEAEQKNPQDPSKPYYTPWKPRPYMSAFAFIPPYLEVNQNICAAVYLRHPVARPGSSEVPTPFNEATSQLAFNWYLQRK